MSGLARRLAAAIISAASRLPPPHLSSWPRAMARELLEIEDDGAALLFAAGCLRAAAGLAIGERLRSVRAAVSAVLISPASPNRSLPAMTFLSARPRLLGLICGTGAVAVGLSYMLAAGAPRSYLLVNLAALVLGASLWLALGRTGRPRLAGSGPATLALSLALLLTALFGIAVDGASRWVSVGPLTLQVSLILLPVMIILFARRPDSAGTAGMTVAALALALQPDRAMAGVLAAALVALWLAKPGRPATMAAAAAILALGWTWLIPDSLPATAYVDRVLYTAFDVHPIAGAAVAVGAGALLLPAAAGVIGKKEDRAPFLAFGACWAAAVAAAALGNYPTPLVGYGGSAVLGYLLSAALLPGGARESEPRALATAPPAAGTGPDRTIPDLRVARPA